MKNSYKYFLLLAALLMATTLVGSAGDSSPRLTRRIVTKKTKMPPRTIIDKEKPTTETAQAPSIGFFLTEQQVDYGSFLVGVTNASSPMFSMQGDGGMMTVGTGSSEQFGVDFGFWIEQEPDIACCVDVGDVNNSGGAIPVDVTDILALVSYLFQGGGQPVCLDATDATGGCEGIGPDVVDLLAIVGYLFQGADPLPDCHDCGW